MELTPFFRSVLEQDRAPVVICDLNHTIIYLNPSAVSQYSRHGGADLLGRSLLDCHNASSRELIDKAVGWFASCDDNNIVYEYRNDKENKDVYIVALRDENSELIGYYEKHEYRSRETAKLYDFHD